MNGLGDVALESPGDLARVIVATNRYVTLATADTNGHPWATPVWYAARDLGEFFWVSRPGARHSQNISARPVVGMVIFDSSVPPGEGTAVYLEAVAEEVVGAEARGEGLAVFNERSQAQGLKAWGNTDVTAPAQHRLFRARASAVYVLDDHDRRVPVT